MKATRFLSMFTLLCNIAFIVFAGVNIMHAKDPQFQWESASAVVRWLQNTIIVLGFLAFFINLLMCAWYGILLLRKKKSSIPLVLAGINFIFLVLQILFFFVY